MHRALRSLAACALLALTAAVPAIALPGNKYPSTQTTQPCGDDSRVTYDGPAKLWPPNHKPVDVVVSITDDSGDGVTIDTMASHNQVADDGSEWQGSGNTDPATDANPPAAMATGDGYAEVGHALRAERAGKDAEKAGRTYSIDYIATADDGETQCSGTFTVLVPHDMRGGADWKK